jgi:predicted Na+-dependent transporter
MNPTLKFLIMLLSNLKNVHLRFGKYQPWSLHQQVLLPIFLQQLKKNYASQVYNNQSLLRLVGSMGLLGNMNEKVSNLKYAC